MQITARKYAAFSASPEGCFVAISDASFSQEEQMPASREESFLQSEVSVVTSITQEPMLDLSLSDSAISFENAITAGIICFLVISIIVSASMPTVLQ